MYFMLKYTTNNPANNTDTFIDCIEIFFIFFMETSIFKNVKSLYLLTRYLIYIQTIDISKYIIRILIIYRNSKYL